jgi:putative membrane protein
LTPAVAFPGWTAHPDVWLLVGLFAAGYAIAIVRLGPKWSVPGQAVVTRFQVTCWTLGVLAMWVASDYPVHDIAERYNFSVHMVQHLIFSMVVAPLLLLGMPAWLLRRVLAPRWLFATVRTLSRFIPALLVFNIVLVFTHWPVIVDAALHSGFVHFAVHALLLVSSLIVWMPIVSPLPEIPRLQPVMQMLYLFAWSVVPTVPASFLTFGASPLYKFYEHVPHLYGLSTLEDQQAAGLIMKIGAGLLLWLIIAVVFFRWASEEERANTPRHGLDEMDRELTQMGLRR